jgi:hypothetical protein
LPPFSVAKKYENTMHAAEQAARRVHGPCRGVESQKASHFFSTAAATRPNAFDGQRGFLGRQAALPSVFTTIWMDLVNLLLDTQWQLVVALLQRSAASPTKRTKKSFRRKSNIFSGL